MGALDRVRFLKFCRSMARRRLLRHNRRLFEIRRKRAAAPTGVPEEYALPYNRRMKGVS